MFDIVRFFTNERFLIWFLEFDPESFFMILKKIYLEQEPYDYITNQADFIAMYHAKTPGLEPCLNLSAILEVVCYNIDTILEKDREQSSEGKLSAKGEAL